MMKSLEKSGRTVDEALRAALAELGLDVDDVNYSYEIVTRPKSGFLGIGSVPAVVRVSYEAKDEPAPQAPKAESKPAPAAKPAAPKAEKKSAPKPESKPAPQAVEAAPVVDEDAEYAAIRTFLSGLLSRMGVAAASTRFMSPHHPGSGSS